ncbi:hypothetical protein Skr01_42560 [Sphaerisporangium krabiense]|uniref:Uncharacterized protein n=1 Tax=Sphaerisporangium krabiense TaxID=763782 RepID=A0A7W9DPG2_9ACTN|nr:hypothetical protein [Sphaerisporangium krabiense]MBB5625315.1 hypothetical protein [Sphaerisporangium krabiense]GII64171.1 hypothetical protein Skr01_42560 [Sphaerisporangium krabiense]
MSDPCEHRRGPRRARRAQTTRGRAYARAGYATSPARQGWFAHRCGVSRCHQVVVQARLSSEEMTWRGDD